MEAGEKDAMRTEMHGPVELHSYIRSSSRRLQAKKHEKSNPPKLTPENICDGTLRNLRLAGRHGVRVYVGVGEWGLQLSN